MTAEEVRTRVAEMAASAGYDEHAHGLEGRLRRDVLAAIAAGRPDAATLADRAGRILAVVRMAAFFCLENEQMCGTIAHRGEPAREAVPHLAPFVGVEPMSPAPERDRGITVMQSGQAAIVPHLPGAVANELTECGWPAEGTRVTRYQLTVAISNHEQNRKLELFPARYDNRPLYARALERRVSR